MFPRASDAMLCGVSNSPSLLPFSPHDFTQSPFLSYLATRELMYPSLMKMLPCLSQVTSVGWRKFPSTWGRGGVTRVQCSASSDASFLRPKTIDTRPAGLNLTTMSEPLSTVQMLSSRSTRTVCAYDHAYRFLPISRMNLPSLSNSSNCDAVAAYAGPVVLPRLKTKTWPCELTATPDASPRYRSAGSFRNSASAVYGISGAGCCAKAVAAARLEIRAMSQRFTEASLK